MPKTRILLLEDSPLDDELARACLTRGGLDFEMRRVENRAEFIAELETESYDLILADYSLPSFDGLAALEIARKRWPHLPFLFVSGGLGEEVAIDALKRGATDYVLKQRLDRLVLAVTRALAEARERSNRRRAELALRESEERHRLILESVKDYAIITLDLEGVVSSWNKGAERVLGYQEVEILGRSGALIFTPEDIRNGTPERELSRAALHGRAEDERWHVRKGGEQFWGSGAVRPLLDEAGELRGFVKVMRDMTERKRVEEAQKEADRRKDDFLAMLAHELRNPLSAVNNAIQLARRSGRSEHFEWAKDVIGQQVGHLSRLIDDILDVSRITRGKIQLRTRREAPAPILLSAIEAVRPLIEERRHELKVSLSPHLAPIMADATRLEQIVLNLLTNAAKYTEEEGQIHVTAEPVNDDLVITVRDDGVGIDAEMLSRVFDPFVQAAQTLDRAQGGLGIGLTLARTLAEMHGGSLVASSGGLGRGSEFVLRLPLAETTGVEAAPFSTSPRPTRKQGPRILVVDDNVDSARGLESLLTLLGYDVRTSFDGWSALEVALNHRPAVVLLDIGLPGMDGYEVATKLRSDPRLRETVLIAVTGYGQEEDRRRSREAGFDHHLIKPVDFDTLLALLEQTEETASSVSLQNRR